MNPFKPKRPIYTLAYVLFGYWLLMGFSCSQAIGPAQTGTSPGPTINTPTNPSSAVSSTVASSQEQVSSSSAQPDSLVPFILETNGLTQGGLLVYLHGDGAALYPAMSPQLAKIAQDNQLAMLMVLAPYQGLRQDYFTGSTRTMRSWQASPTQSAEYLQGLLSNTLDSLYTVDSTQVYFAGASGGAHFISSSFIPLFGENYQGGAVLLCGGLLNTSSKLAYEQSFKRHFFLEYFTAKNDFLWFDAESSYLQYKNGGFDAAYEWPGTSVGTSHCAFDIPTVLRDILTKRL
jgi:hypothetical protein